MSKIGLAPALHGRGPDTVAQDKVVKLVAQGRVDQVHFFRVARQAPGNGQAVLHSQRHLCPERMLAVAEIGEEAYDNLPHAVLLQLGFHDAADPLQAHVAVQKQGPKA